MNIDYEYEQYLDTDVFITQEELINDYGINPPHKTISTLYVKDVNIFNTFTSSNLVTINTQNGKTTMSETLLLDLIRNPGMFRYLLQNLFNPSAVVVEIRLVTDGEINRSAFIRLKRIDVLSFFQQYDTSSLTANERMRIALLFSTSHRETLEKAYKDDVLIRELDGFKYTYYATELINIIFLPEDEYQEFIKNGNSKEVKAFFIVEFFELNRIIEKYLLPDYVLERLSRLKKYEDIDYESLNKCLNTNDEDDRGISILEQFELNPRLESYLFKSIKPETPTLEAALQLYIKLCEVLTYDEEYYASSHSAEIRNMHENPLGIEEITVENNKVINYEFILIYAKLLSKLGISYTLSSGFGGEQGPLLKFRYNEYLVSINAIEVTINNDLTNAKINKPLTGIKSINESKVSHDKFEELFTKVQEDYLSAKKDQEEFNQALEEYNELFSVADLAPSDKIKFLINLIKAQKLTGIDSLEYINQIYQKILGSDFKINFLSVKGKKYKPIVLLSIEDFCEYYLITLDNPPVSSLISEEELIEKFETGEFAYTNRQDKVPGLILEGGKSYVRRT